jgi:hypothetical protein
MPARWQKTPKQPSLSHYTLSIVGCGYRMAARWQKTPKQPGVFESSTCIHKQTHFNMHLSFLRHTTHRLLQGAAAAWLRAGNTPKKDGVVVMQCGVGNVDIRIDRAPDDATHVTRLSFAAPPLIKGGAPTDDDIAIVCDVLGVAADEIVASQWADNGVGLCEFLCFYFFILLCSFTELIVCSPHSPVYLLLHINSRAGLLCVYDPRPTCAQCSPI